MLMFPFTQDEATAAYEQWGCNCGPAALAFALQISLDTVRDLLPGFDAKRYVNPTMMLHALRMAGQQFDDISAPWENGIKFHKQISLVRIQWLGPWTDEGANPKWAYRQTHWIAAWTDGAVNWIFDVNCGVRRFDEWDEEIVPLIVASIPRAYGGWFATHILRLRK